MWYQTEYKEFSIYPSCHFTLVLFPPLKLLEGLLLEIERCQLYLLVFYSLLVVEEVFSTINPLSRADQYFINYKVNPYNTRLNCICEVILFVLTP